MYGVGIDLVETERMARIIEKWGSRFLKRVFSDDEIRYCEKYAQAAINFSARFAAKESFLKALGIGLGMGVGLREIEVINDDNTGKPDLILHGEARNMIEKNDIAKVCLSLTHTKKYAAAIVLLEKK